MNIGGTIKKLRKQKDMTQEQLAEYLKVSPQAVSRWEINSTFPDITLLPAIANIFDVSADELLGIDVKKKERYINDIIHQAIEYNWQFDYDKSIEILRNGLKEYPNSYKLMCQLMLLLAPQRQNKTKEEALKTIKEIIELGEKVLAECTDDKWRHQAIHSLCVSYSTPEIGKTDKAIELAEKMPGSSITRDELLECIYTGDKKFKQQRKNMLADFGTVVFRMSQFNDGILYEDEKRDEYGGYTAEENIVIRKKSNALIEIMFEDGNYGIFRHQMVFNYIEMAASYAKLNDYPNAIENLRFSSEYAIKFDTEYDASMKYTSLLFKDEPNIYHVQTKDNASMLLLKRIKHSIFDPIRESKEFIEVEESLKEYAKSK